MCGAYFVEMLVVQTEQLYARVAKYLLSTRFTDIRIRVLGYRPSNCAAKYWIIIENENCIFCLSKLLIAILDYPNNQVSRKCP